MITAEQADQLFKANKEASREFSVSNIFIGRYKDLSLLIRKNSWQLSQGKRKKTPEQIFLSHFRADENPWTEPSGRRLATVLFGADKAPYAAEMWDLLGTMPYQSGWSRKPFRTSNVGHTLSNKISAFHQLALACAAGFQPFDVADTMRYAVYYPESAAPFAPLIATALNREKPAGPLFELAWDIFQGEDEIGATTRSLIKGLLMTERPDCWELVEKLLLAAQREEGLRQTIFETIDESNVMAFRHFIRLIREHDLARFSAVIRGVDTWFGFGWDAPKKKTINRALEIAEVCMEGRPAALPYLLGEDNMAAYVALWSVGMEEVDQALEAAAMILSQGGRARQLTALYFILQTGKSGEKIGDWIVENFGSDLLQDYYSVMVVPDDLAISDSWMQRIVVQAQSLPKEGKTFDSGVFAWMAPKVTPEHFYNFLIRRASKEQLMALAQDISAVPSDSRTNLLRKLFPDHYSWSMRYDKQKRVAVNIDKDPWIRGVMHQSLTDRNSSVVSTGLMLLRSVKLEGPEVEVITGLLKRKGKELRGALIETVLAQPDQRIKQFSEQLLPAKSVDQRLAGLEILSVLREQERLVKYIDHQIAAYRERPKFSKNEEVLLERFTPAVGREIFSVENGFGVVDYSNTRPIIQPKLKFTAPRKGGFLSKLTGATETFLFGNFVKAEKIRAAIAALARIIKDNATFEYTITYKGDYTNTVLLQNHIGPMHANEEQTPLERIDDLPLAEKFKAWYESSALNDFELFYLILHLGGKDRGNGHTWYRDIRNIYYPVIPEIESGFGERQAWDRLKQDLAGVARLFYHAYADHPTMNAFQVDMLEDMVARWPAARRTHVTTKDRWNYEMTQRWTDVLQALHPRSITFANHPTDDPADLKLLTRYYDLNQLLFMSGKAEAYPPSGFHYEIDPFPKNRFGRISSDTSSARALYQQGIVTQDELLIHGLHDATFLGNLYHAEELNARIKNPANHWPVGLADELAANLLSVELERGDLATEATQYTNQFKKIEGAHYLIALNERLGKETLHRGYSYGSDTSKKESFSALIKKTEPAATDTMESFAALANATNITTKRWLEVAMYAPQWASWIGDLLRIDNLESAVWWFHAHASEYASDQKAAIVARYSPIEMADFREGAIDIDWFTEVYASVGKKTWKLLHDAAKYVTDGNGHRQVKLYSAIMLGEVKITETLKKITEKRDKVYVKGLGLVPLSRRIPRKDLLKRYELLQQFLHESKQFGNQRKESEKKAVEIALDNLARNAGYSDPVRFSWIMEGQSTQAIMDEAVVEIDKVQVELVINEFGKAGILVLKDGKSQKSIPAKLRKHKDILKLKANKNVLRKQHGRTLQSLEKAMVDGQTFTIEEIEEINEHPVVKTLLAKLVLFHPEKQISGFWHRGVLNDVTGKPYELAPDEVVRIAHPTDLYATVQWDLFQRYAFDSKLVQPFKQIFRELYLITPNEWEEKFRSSRYQGNQIQVKKTVALLTGRGWTVGYEDGLQKVDYKRGVVASLYAMADWFSASDIEAPTLEQVAFHSRKNYQSLALDEIDPILFSETMRDVDLVVSVANAGQVDPEASHSSMEMRAALARESARLFKLKNVEVKERHIIIQGMHGTYSLHLGSGMVSKNGLQLGIIPVHSQHRGRIFLPFVDDDPKSAEIIAKMRMLAEDGRIKDPTVLAQLMR